MPAEATQTDPDPIPDAPSAADDLAAPAGITTPVDGPGTDADSDDAALDAAYQAIKSGKGREGAASVYAGDKPAATKPKPSAPAQPATAASTDTPGTTPEAQPDAQPAGLDDTQRQLLKRFQLDEGDLPADPARRTKFLSNLQQRHDDQARMFQELQQLKNTGQRPAQQATREDGTPNQPPAPPANPAQGDPLEAVDKVWKEYFGDDATIAAPLKAALTGIVGPLAQQQQQVQASLSAFYQHKEEQDLEAGFASLKSLGVELDRRTTAGQSQWNKVQETAKRLIIAAQQDPNWSPFKYGWKEAISEAAPSVFKAEIQLAQRRQQAQEARKRFNGSPDPGARPSTTRPVPDEDTVLDEIYGAIKNGATREEAGRLAAGRR